MRRSLFIACAAVICFGMAAALLSGWHVAGVATISPIMIATGSVMCLIGFRHRGPFQAKLMLQIAGFNAAQLGLYVFALSVSPVAIAAALHLTAPVWLLLWTSRGKGFNKTVVGIITLMVIGLGAAAGVASGGTDLTVLGLIAATGSAIVIACYITFLKTHIDSISLDWDQGITQIMGGCLFLPFFFAGVHDITVNHLYEALLIGGLLYAPGGILIWRALRGLSPSVVTSIGLMEGPLAVLFAASLLHGEITLLQIFSMCCLLGAVLWEVLSASGRADPPLPIGP